MMSQVADPLPGALNVRDGCRPPRVDDFNHGSGGASGQNDSGNGDCCGFGFGPCHKFQRSFHESQGRAAGRDAFGHGGGGYYFCQRRGRGLRGIGSDGCGDQGGRGRDAALKEEPAQFFQRPADPLARGVFAQAEIIPHLRQALVLKVAQQQGLPVFFAQLRQRLVQHGRNLFPQRVGRCGLNFRLHLNLQLMLPASGGGPQVRQGGEPRRFKQPTRQDRAVTNPPGFIRQDDEHGLRDFFR